MPNPRATRHTDAAGRDPDGYADLAGYAALGDGRTVALVAPDGDIDWFPLPDIDSPPVFAALLDAEHGGRITLRPTEPYEVERHYVDGTNVLVAEYRTASGRVRVTDALNTGVAGRLPWAELARRVDGVEGSVSLSAEVVPGTCLDTASPWVHDTVHGTVLRVDGLTLAVRTLEPDTVDVRDDRIAVGFVTAPGSRHLLGLSATDREPLFLPRPEDVDRGVDRTIANWQAWSDVFDYDGEYADAVVRSALALKLLIHSPSGSIVAAATTSLPESPGGGKNWDYRFAWSRDAAYTLTALFRFGLREETHAAMSWMLRTLRHHGSRPTVMFDVHGEVPDEGPTHHDVPGWRGIGPVVSGNGAADQLQLGVFGDVFSIVQLYVDHGNVLDASTGRLLAELADVVCDLWRSKDAGMWELHDPRHYTSSKMACWQALTHAVHLAEIGQVPGDGSRWRTEAGRIRTWIEEHCWNDDVGAYVWYPGTDELDASVLLHAVSGYDRGPRMSRTIDAVRSRLGHGAHLYRYSGVDAEEKTFVACGFWAVSALALVDRVSDARDLMAALLDTVPPLGVMAEMYDPGSGQWWGNLPQGLSHLALLNAAITLSTGPGPDPAPDDATTPEQGFRERLERP